MRVAVAMSGGVDSSVAAALLLEQGHAVVGITMRLWRGAAADIGCCSEAEIDDARRVCNQLGVDHRVFNFTDDFDRHVVDPYVDGHAHGLTPNPCVECNRHLKFDRFLRRARQLGFDGIATGHHARVAFVDGRWALLRGADAAKDQSYVLYVLDQPTLGRCLFPVGAMTKDEVRARAAALGLPTADKPDSQDVCFVQTGGGRATFLGDRIPLRPGRVVDSDGRDVGSVPAVELVTVGQRRGLGLGGGQRRYAVAVDVASATVVVGDTDDTFVGGVSVRDLTWVGEPVAPGTEVLVQSSAHGASAPGVFEGERVAFRSPQRRIAPGQSVVLYRADEVLGGGIAVA